MTDAMQQGDGARPDDLETVQKLRDGYDKIRAELREQVDHPALVRIGSETA